MQRTVTILVDDLDGTDAVETVRFALDGESFEIDLNERNAAALRAAIRPWTGRAHADGRPERSRTELRSSGDSRAAEIRAWAAGQGITVPARGRIPASVVREFDAR